MEVGAFDTADAPCPTNPDALTLTETPTVLPISFQLWYTAPTKTPG